ncbi:unnamed protein product [Gongylonema pulchrum]|uniref:Integrase n=1 Tax=Gongylonema pulchrum TaxID=637853 RepID=A0A183D779_9BILA|nr:unnamed protein product [Gongylonema pulchrum]
MKQVKKSEAIELEDYVIARRPFYARWYQNYQNRALAKRLEKYDEDEAKVFVAQKLFKVDGIICDEQTKLLLIQSIVLVPAHARATDESTELIRKYG